MEKIEKAVELFGGPTGFGNVSLRLRLARFFSNKRQSLPTPNDFPIFFGQTKKSAGGLRRIFDQSQNFFAILLWRSGGLKIPVEVRLLERFQADRANRQSTCFAPLSPRARCDESLVTRIAQFFEIM